jgi:ABC-type transport system involved in cytochrome c biogenesis ATPase subunit
MKIKSLHFNAVGPLQDESFDLTDDWTGGIHTQVLLSGPNGCGKSTVLRAVAMLWEAAGYWLDQRKQLPKNHPVRLWLQRWGGVGVVLADTGVTGDAHTPLGLFFGDASGFAELKKTHLDVHWLGESVVRGAVGAPRKTLVVPEEHWLTKFSDARKKMILGFDGTALPNIVFMDAEERRWVTPKRRVGEFLAESPQLRWLPRYLATDDWDSQLEASLINLKLTHEAKFKKVLSDLNAFLFDKSIESDMPEGSNRLRVRLKSGSKGFITLDDLSAGEHQALIMIYLIARWAEKGCVVLIDEPDLYLHPSLISLLLSRLENMVRELGGQLLITSHIRTVWDRYETAGRRIELGAQHP